MFISHIKEKIGMTIEQRGRRIEETHFLLWLKNIGQV
jgi:hypothetical protein